MRLTAEKDIFHLSVRKRMRIDDLAEKQKAAFFLWLWRLGSPFRWALFDALLAFACMAAGYYTSPSAGNLSHVSTHLDILYSATIFGTISFLTSYILALSREPHSPSRFRIIVLTLVLTGAALSGTLFITSLFFYKQIGRYILLIATVLFFATEASARLLWSSVITVATHKVAIFSNDRSNALFKELLRRAKLPIEIVFSGLPEVTDSDAVALVLREASAKEIVIFDLEQSVTAPLLDALNQGIAVSTMASFSERHFFKIPVTFLSPNWFFDIDLKQHHPFYEAAKRAMDFTLAICGGILCSPLVFFSALLIKLESKGPIFYTQTRVGLRQRPFKICKLRTMRVDAEKNGAQWASVADARITRAGRLLRRLRIDELPQLWNIFKGDMAFVGPRPERPEFVEILEKSIPFYRQRHLVKPGLTGWAQICFPYGASATDAYEKLSYDFYYLKNMSILLDLQIALQTIGAIAKGSR